ncbi:MAG: endonuclease/exonuclease/phosphatase family protein [Bacteroidota bacterium]
MKILKRLLIMIGVILFVFLAILGYFTLRKYNPEKKVVVAKNNVKPKALDTVTCMSWNIGYCGLGAEMDFFYDGGEKVRTSKEKTEENLSFIKDQLTRNNNIQLFLLQEVDTASKRSYYTDQFSHISKALDSYQGYFSTNYHVDFVPVPVTNPLGKVRGGLATFSKFTPKRVIRYAFPSSYSWPVNLFMLDRCFMVTEFMMKNGKELIVINTHNSAYDDGSLKRREMKFLKKFLLGEYKKGNYLIVGGDWNQFPPGIEKYGDRFDLSKTSTIKKDFMPSGWKWVADYETATNRSLDAPLNENTRKAVIDFYLISPNVEVLNVKTDNHKFKHSDHHPVTARFRLVR